jgi:hypothetical protein
LTIQIVTHKAVEKNCRNLLENKRRLPVEEVKSIARDLCEDAWRGDIDLPPEQQINLNKTKGAFIDMSMALSLLHHHDIAPDLRPVAVEEPFVIQLDNYPVDLAGQVDLREARVIRDVKTKGQRLPAEAAKSMQMAMYSLGDRVRDAKEREVPVTEGRLPKLAKIDGLIKTKTPYAMTVEAVPDETWIKPLMHRIQRFIEIIDAVKAGHQAFTPAQPDYWCCSRLYCGFHADCPYWSGR